MTTGAIKKVLEGDKDAFRVIVKEYQDHAYTLAVSVVKDEFLARDVVQVSFIKAYKALSTFRENSKFSTWFYRIVINEAFNKQKKEKNITQLTDTISMNEDTSKLNSVFSKMEQDYQRYYINEVLSRLPGNYSLALRLFYLEEFNLKEISEITGWTDSNTRVMLHRARKEMKKLLTDVFNQQKEDLY